MTNEHAMAVGIYAEKIRHYGIDNRCTHLCKHAIECKALRD